MTAAAANDAAPRDDLVTLVAIGLLAYATADIAHHVLGHGGACRALGGRIVSLSSVFVNCTVRGSAIDLAGPFANLAVGLAALALAHHLSAASTARLFFALAAAFNLFWFALLLLFSAATRTDDFAWPMAAFHVSEPVRYGLIAVGGLLYLLSVRAVAVPMAGYARPRARVWRIVVAAWLTAGVLACATALFDRHPAAAILHHAAPQSFIVSIGLLFLPQRAAQISTAVSPVIGLSVPWVAAALIAAAVSIVFLGPGFSL